MVNKNKKPPKGVKPLEALVWCLLDKSNHGFLQYDTVTLRLFVGKSSPDILFRPRDRIRIHSEGTSKVSKMTQIISIPDQKVFLISEKADYLSIRNDDYCQEKRVIQCSNLRCQPWFNITCQYLIFCNDSYMLWIS